MVPINDRLASTGRASASVEVDLQPAWMVSHFPLLQMAGLFPSLFRHNALSTLQTIGSKWAAAALQTQAVTPLLLTDKRCREPVTFPW